MSFAAAQSRLFMLISMEYDSELQMQYIDQHRMYLQQVSAGLQQYNGMHEVGSEADKVLQGRIQQLNQAEKILEMRYRTIQTRKEMASKQRQQAEAEINQNIKRAFNNPYAGNQ